MKEFSFDKQWDKCKHKAKERWNKLTDQDFNKINGKRDQLVHSLQERYGWQRPQAEEEVKNFEHMMCNECNKSCHHDQHPKRKAG
ncbi:MAG TPA: hypothetical protein VJK48_00010 [Chlamydiales bacterium]|nr:hypothetical protein [Chlamydiales bacterium]